MKVPKDIKLNRHTITSREFQTKQKGASTNCFSHSAGIGFRFFRLQRYCTQDPYFPLVVDYSLP